MAISAPIVGTTATTSANATTTLDVTVPAGVTAGMQLLLFVDFQTPGTAGTISVSGWSSTRSGLYQHAPGTTGVQMRVLSRTAIAGDAGSIHTITVTNITGRIVATVLAYPGATLIESDAEVAFLANASSTATIASGAITTAADRWLVYFTGNRGAFTYTAGAGLVERADTASANTGQGIFDSNGIVAAGSGITRTVTASGASSTGGSMLFALGPVSTPPTLNLLSDTEIYQLIDARTSTAGSAGTMAYTISPTTGVKEVIDGYFLVPTGHTYTVTATESPSGMTDSEVVVIPAASAPTTGNIVRLRWTGTAWV